MNWKKNIRDWGATMAGILVAVCVAWQDIDWATFDFNRDKFKLALSGMIAAGGLLSKFKKPKNDTKD